MIGDVRVDVDPTSTATTIADAHDLPFDDKSFDVAYCSELLHHVENPKQVVCELERVAKTVIINELNIAHPLVRWWCSRLPWDDDARFFDEDRFRGLLPGYEVAVTSFVFLPDAWMWATKKEDDA